MGHKNRANNEQEEEEDDNDEDQDEEKHLEMNLLIEIVGDQTITVIVTAMDTVHTLKTKIEEKQSEFPVRVQSILNGKGQMLEDRKTLSSYNIHAEDTLYLKRFQPATRIFIKSITGKATEMSIDEGSYVRDIKTKIEKERDIPFDEITLIYAGKRLQNGKTLREYKIAHDATLHFCRRK